MVMKSGHFFFQHFLPIFDFFRFFIKHVWQGNHVGVSGSPSIPAKNNHAKLLTATGTLCAPYTYFFGNGGEMERK